MFTEDKKRHLIQEIINYFSTERNEEIGVIAAEELLEFFIQTIGNELYNQGIDDAKKLLKEQSDLLQLELETTLKKG